MTLIYNFKDSFYLFFWFLDTTMTDDYKRKRDDSASFNNDQEPDTQRIYIRADDGQTVNLGDIYGEIFEENTNYNDQSCPYVIHDKEIALKYIETLNQNATDKLELPLASAQWNPNVNSYISENWIDDNVRGTNNKLIMLQEERTLIEKQLSECKEQIKLNAKHQKMLRQLQSLSEGLPIVRYSEDKSCDEYNKMSALYGNQVVQMQILNIVVTANVLRNEITNCTTEPKGHRFVTSKHFYDYNYLRNLESLACINAIKFADYYDDNCEIVEYDSWYRERCHANYKGHIYIMLNINVLYNRTTILQNENPDHTKNEYCYKDKLRQYTHKWLLERHKQNIDNEGFFKTD